MSFNVFLILHPALYLALAKAHLLWLAWTYWQLHMPVQIFRLVGQ